MATARPDVPAGAGADPATGEEPASTRRRKPTSALAKSSRRFASTTAALDPAQPTGPTILPPARRDLAETIVESALDCIVVMDAHGRIVEFNPEAQRTFGYTRKQAVGRRVADLMPREVAAAHRRGLKRYLATGIPKVLNLPIETVAQRADGSLFPVELRVTRAPDREPPLFLGFLRDLTDVKRTQEALLESEQRLRVVLENVPEMIYHYRLSPEPGYEYVSPAATRILGYEPSEFYADPVLWHRIVHHEDLPGLIGDMATDPTNLSLPIRCIRKDGTVIHCQLGRSLLRDRTGKTVAAVGVIRDETEIFQMHRHLRRSNERLRKVHAERVQLMRRLVAAHEDERARVATAIHDDPIQAVTALAMRISAMRRRALGDAELDRKMEEIERSASEAVTRLRHLMFELHPTTLDRAGLVATLRTHLDQLARDEGPELRFDNRLSREPPQHVRLAVYRVIQEALTNARRHARAETLSIELLGGDDEVVARIRDDGIGFVIEEITSPAGHLGLSAMREHVEALKGSLSIDSTPGAGTTVEARVPTRQRPSGNDSAGG